MCNVESKLRQINEALSDLKLALCSQISIVILDIYFDLIKEPHCPGWFIACHMIFAHRERLKCFKSFIPHPSTLWDETWLSNWPGGIFYNEITPSIKNETLTCVKLE